MKTILLIIMIIFVLLASGYLVSKYLDINDQRKKKIINRVFITITIISIVLVIIFFFYFLSLILNTGPTIL